MLVKTQFLVHKKPLEIDARTTFIPLCAILNQKDAKNFMLFKTGMVFFDGFCYFFNFRNTFVLQHFLAQKRPLRIHNVMFINKNLI